MGIEEIFQTDVEVYTEGKPFRVASDNIRRFSPEEASVPFLFEQIVSSEHPAVIDVSDFEFTLQCAESIKNSSFPFPFGKPSRMALNRDKLNIRVDMKTIFEEGIVEARQNHHDWHLRTTQMPYPLHFIAEDPYGAGPFVMYNTLRMPSILPEDYNKGILNADIPSFPNMGLDLSLDIATQGIFGHYHPMIEFLLKNKLKVEKAVRAGCDTTTGPIAYFENSSEKFATLQSLLINLYATQFKEELGKDFMGLLLNGGTESVENAKKVAQLTRFNALMTHPNEKKMMELEVPEGLRPLKDKEQKLFDYFKNEMMPARPGKKSHISLYESLFDQLGLNIPKKKETKQAYVSLPLFTLSFFDDFHGRTAGSLASTTSADRSKQTGFVFPTWELQVPYNDPSFEFETLFPRFEEYKLNPDDFKEYGKFSKKDIIPLEILVRKKLLRKIRKDKSKIPIELLAGVLMEPIQGEGGYVIPGADWLGNLNNFLGKYKDKYGIKFISDEVQAGLGRTGKMAAMSNWVFDKEGKTIREHLNPDIIACAKAQQVGALYVDEKIGKEIPDGALSCTWSGGDTNRLWRSLAQGYMMKIMNSKEQKDAELKKLFDPYLGEETLFGHAETIGSDIEAKIVQLKGDENYSAYFGTADNAIRRVGSMLAFTMRDQPTRDRFVEDAFMHGLILQPCGSDSVRIIGPTDMRQREVKIMYDAMDATFSHMKATEENRGDRYFVKYGGQKAVDALRYHA
ncbi:MAG: aminotransferase class III-fold pyridoxal phosphate-dependent enzyme [Nanoarchaeota archaeon]|nr:aminotransferase class III-fold pyridoxal phosphate-dependent enzyme [Nanoarchaeota archaeon]